jgi:Outer membrane protein beta-barrel domain
MRYVFYTLFNLLLLTSTFAQSNKFQAGEILLKNGIQKTGYVLGQFHLEAPKGVYFKPDEVTKSEYLEYSDIQEVRFGETLRYITHCTQNTAQERCHWLKTLLLGKINLHQSASDEGLYFMEEAGTFNAIRSPSFEGTLTLLKRKCEGFVAPANAKFGTATLIQVVANYAKCKYPNDEPTSLYAPETPASWFIGPKVGVNLGNASVYEFNYYGQGRYIGRPGISPGLALQVRVTEHWSATVELLYFKRSFKSDSVNVWDILSPNYSKIDIDLSFIEIPLSGQYYFSTGKISPFVQAGVNVGIPLNRNFQQEMFNASPSELERQPEVEFIGMGFGFGGGLGLNMQMNERACLQFQGQYTYFTNTFRAQSSVFGTGSINQSETPFKIAHFQLGLAWLIRL